MQAPTTRVIDADLEDIATAIWAALFDVELTPASVWSPVERPAVTGCVQIGGAWQGAVMVQCPIPLASALTATMLGGGSPATEDIKDALGEVTNIIAGNVKALLPEPSQISLPTVALGSDYRMHVMGTTAVSTVAFSCQGHTLSIRLLQRDAASADAAGALAAPATVGEGDQC